VLAEIGAADVPELLAFNKADVAPAASKLAASHPGSVRMSAHTGAGVGDLLTAMSDRLRSLSQAIELVVPYNRGDVVAALHREGEVLIEAHEESATRLRARLDPVDAARFGEFLVDARPEGDRS
jgi:GTP-binding protein HflX